jgi:uncharacterized glyoxalase superfamily protein PhnB
MSTRTRSAQASIEVPTDPGTAFRIFTEEIGRWWQAAPTEDGRIPAMCIEPGVGGRFLAVYDEGVDAVVLAEVTVWDPGERYVAQSRADFTETEILFVASRMGTLVKVEQRLLPGAAPDFAPFSCESAGFLDWFQAGVSDREEPALAQASHRCLNAMLRYDNVAKAATWLVEAFGFEWRGRRSDPMRRDDYCELTVGDSALVIMSGAEANANHHDHELLAYVHDLDGHLDRALAHGARILEEDVAGSHRRYVAEDLEGHRWIFAQIPR